MEKREFYTADEIKSRVDNERDRLFSSYAIGRSPTWTVDLRTKDLICLSTWLSEELTRLGIDDLGRITQQGVFNRYSRSDEDLFVLAAQVMNDALVDNIPRHRKTHRRWG